MMDNDGLSFNVSSMTLGGTKSNAFPLQIKPVDNSKRIGLVYDKLLCEKSMDCNAFNFLQSFGTDLTLQRRIVKRCN